MINYNWDTVKKIYSDRNQAIPIVEANLVWNQIADHPILVGRIGTHISTSPIVTAIQSTVADPYIFSIYIFGISIFVSPPDVVAFADGFNYLLVSTKDGITEFDSAAIDIYMDTAYKTVFPYLAGIAEEYRVAEMTIGNVPHLLKVRRFLFAGMLLGFAIRKAISTSGSSPVSWFSEFENYCNSLYAEYLENKGKTSV